MHHKGNQACCHISQPEVAGVSPGDTFTLPCRVYQVEMVLDPRGQTPGQPTPQPQLRVKTWWPPRWMSLAPALWLCELPTPRQLPQAPGSSGRRASSCLNPTELYPRDPPVTTSGPWSLNPSLLPGIYLIPSDPGRPPPVCGLHGHLELSLQAEHTPRTASRPLDVPGRR